MHEANFQCGYITILGRPNVGKSTLMNALLGEKLAIATHKPQTTRNRLMGILNQPHAQIVFVDTPGIPPTTGSQKNSAFCDFMFDETKEALKDMDCIAWVLDAQEGLTESDHEIWQLIGKVPGIRDRLIIAINKIDLLHQRNALLPFIQEVQELTGIAEIFPICALSRNGLDELLESLIKKLPEGPALYPADQISDKNDRFLAAEMIREHLFLTMGEEIPYSTAVEVNAFQEEEDIIRINAEIYVERISQKGMVIGKGGHVLKKVGTAARQEMEPFFGKKIFLQLHVKVLKNWSRDDRFLKQLGYAHHKDSKKVMS